MSLFQDEKDLCILESNVVKDEDFNSAFWKLAVKTWLDRELDTKRAMEFVTRDRLGSTADEEEAFCKFDASAFVNLSILSILMDMLVLKLHY